MFLGVVVFLDPVSELAVERVEAGQIQGTGEELLAHRAKKSFDFYFGRSIAHGSVMEEAAEAGADLDDFLGGVDGAVVHVEGLRKAAFVEGGAESFDERIDVFREKELAVAADARSIVEEGDEPSLNGRAFVLE